MNYTDGYRAALLEAADDLILAFPHTFLAEDGHLGARTYSPADYAEWLRARAEAAPGGAQPDRRRARLEAINWIALHGQGAVKGWVLDDAREWAEGGTA